MITKTITKNNNHSKYYMLILLIVFAIITIIICPFIGQYDGREILEIFRFPRVLTAFLAGFGLSLSGLIFQNIFTNELACPYTLGVSSGASLGVAFISYFHLSMAIHVFSLTIPSTYIGSFFGAMISVSAVYSITKYYGGFKSEILLLSGVAIGLFFSGLILLLQYLSDATSAINILRWTIGGIEVVGFDSFLLMLPFVVISFIFALLNFEELNLLSLGEEISISRGLNVSKIRIHLFIITSLLIAIIISECGPIGFIGLIIPHISRLIIGYNNKFLIPFSTILGGSFLVFCDTIARTLFTNIELPVGIITTIVGGPFFLYLLLKKK
ncbi:MAG: iron ABC transporter permease [Oligoflexia bacterium]|nr:iron ABC transporter permease [Oligoflexia bacterium]